MVWGQSCHPSFIHLSMPPHPLVLRSLPASCTGPAGVCVVLAWFLCPACLRYPRHLTPMDALAVLPATPRTAGLHSHPHCFPILSRDYGGNEQSNEVAPLWPRFQGGTPYCDLLYQHWIRTLFRGQLEAQAEEVHGGKVKSLCNI